MAFQGSLKELPLPDIIQLVSVGGKTGRVTLSREGEEGVIFLRNGNIVHAHVGDLVGEEAIYALSIWSDGEFVFAPAEETTEQTIKRSNTNLLMEAARRSDEWKVLSRKIPSVDMVPELDARPSRHEQVALTPQEWQLVTKIDGRRSIAEIAPLLELSPFDVAKVLYGLLTAELAVLRKEPPRPAPAVSRATAAPAPAPPAPPAPAANPAVPAAGDDSEVAAMLDLAGRIKALGDKHIGLAGAKTVQRQLESAIQSIRSGGGPGAIREMIRELEKTTSLLRGAAAAEQFRADIAELLRTGA
ncbi:MAG TPA: DUF4388 domain-containing protein [Thermoanaerobaculia bacterium]|nr:DUF4388 domain-containing protein [Thermoanaerobaculia bacterium]